MAATLPASTRSESVAVAGTERGRSYLQRGRERVALTDGLQAALDIDERVVLVVAGVRTELIGPGVLRVRSSTAAPAGWEASFSGQGTVERSSGDESKSTQHQRLVGKRSSRHAVRDAARAAGANASSGAWERAAQALRDHDSAAAERALGELTRSSDQKTRDAAQLARAQLQVVDGRASEARATLKRLAASGAPPAIRSRAADLLTHSSPR